MVLPCFTWIQKLNSLFDQKGYSRHIPDDIVIEILTRLPPESVLNCRIVCKQWLEVTSSPYFANKHLKRTNSGLLVQFSFSSTREETEPILFASDEGSRNKYKLRKIHSGLVALNEPYGVQVAGCCDGLIVFKPRYNGFRYFICNLVTREKIILEPPVPSIFCGIFFHRIANEYVIISSSDRNVNDGYPIFVYGSKSKLWRQVAASPYQSADSPTLVIFNGFCHWMTGTDLLYNNEIYDPDVISAPCDNSILTISVEGDKFRIMPHPGEECLCQLQHKHMTLMKMEGQLTCCVIYDRAIFIWLLEDYDTWTWKTGYIVNLEWTLKKFPYIFNSFVPESTHSNLRKRLCYIEDRELVIHWPNVGLFRCHLDSNVVTKMDDGIKKRNNVDFFYHVFPFKANFTSISSWK